VQAVTKDGPAERAGIMIGDIIVRVDGVRLARLSLPAILKRLDGAKDTIAALTIVRNGVAQTFNVRRAFIIPNTVHTEVVDGILRIAITQFNQQTASAVADGVAAAGSVRGVILDLRGDPGGLLDQGVAVADLFLDHGVIATLRGRNPAANQFYAATPGAVAKRAPMVVLVDGLTASASEIVAAALQENGRAVVIGTASVGKGTVQTLIPLANGGELSLTWARVITPDGTLLHERGILPDICTTAPPTGPPPTAGEIIAMAMRKAAVRPVRLPVTNIRAARAACQPEPHIAQATDVETAQRWVTDPTLRASLPPVPVQNAQLTH
jgi:carboxyl-terminal processing protease